MRGMDGYRGREGMRRTRLGEGKREWRDEGRDGGRERERRMRWREGEKEEERDGNEGGRSQMTMQCTCDGWKGGMGGRKG